LSEALRSILLGTAGLSLVLLRRLAAAARRH
jgi:hypothetical protein